MKKHISYSPSTLVFGVLVLAAYACILGGCADPKVIGFVRRGDYDGLRSSVAKATDVNRQNELGYTALMYASKSGDDSIVELLLSAGADIEARALMDVKVLKPTDHAGLERLRTRNARLGMEEYTGYREMTAIMIASDHGHPRVVELLLDAGADANAQTKNAIGQFASTDGKTALMFASESGHTETVKLLTRAGARLNAQTGYGWTALMFASENGHSYVARVLLEAGASVNARDLRGFDALMLAARAGHAEIVRVLADMELDLNSALACARTLEIAEILISAGAEGTSPEYPALPLQSRLGNADVVARLLGSGADVNTRDEKWMGATALSAASQFGHVEIVEMLIMAGADINARDTRGWTPLMQAAGGGHARVVRMLIEAGADVDARDTTGRTPLIEASDGRSIARCGSTDIVESLIEAGADVNARGNRGWTALMVASHDKPWRSGDEPIHLSVMQILIDRGADVNLRTVDSGTALWYAKHVAKSPRKIELLERAGAK